ncbi:hypothetical protein DRQ36_06020 [bacterium]|nr:MAG: hypothetical protein DRQ36_06020 [bacterium]
MPDKAITDLLLAESDAIRALVGRIEAPLLKAADICLSCRGRIIVTGMGKSGLIGRKIAATLASTGTASFFIHAAEALHGDLGTVTEDDCAIVISKSGNTAEVKELIPPLKRLGVKIIAITGEPESPLGEEAEIILDIGVSEEAEPIGVVPTTSTVAMLAVGDALATALMVKRGFTKHDFAAFHPAGNLGHLLKRVSEVMHSGDTIPVISPGATVLEGIVAMSEGRLGHVIIAENEHCLAIFADGDLRRTLQAHPHENLVSMPLMEFATCEPKTIAPDAIVEEAIRIMETHKITALPVIEEGRLVGIVHLHDLLESKVV